MKAPWIHNRLHNYLGKVSHQMAASVIGLRHHVEEKRLHVVVQSFVVQEEFGK